MTEAPPFEVVASFTNVHEAHVAQSVLEAAGIETLLDNEHTVSMDWTMSNAIGGVKVLAPADRVEEARSLLTTTALTVEQPEQSPVETNGDVCAQCGGDEFDSVLRGKGFWILTWLTAGIPFGIPARRRFCRRCGAPARGVM